MYLWCKMGIPFYEQLVEKRKRIYRFFISVFLQRFIRNTIRPAWSWCREDQFTYYGMYIANLNAGEYNIKSNIVYKHYTEITWLNGKQQTIRGHKKKEKKHLEQIFSLFSSSKQNHLSMSTYYRYINERKGNRPICIKYLHECFLLYGAELLKILRKT